MKKSILKILKSFNHCLIPFLVLYLAILILKITNLYDHLINFLMAFQPLLYGLLLALFLQPLIEWAKLRMKDKQALYLVYGSLVLLTFLLCFSMIPMLLNSLMNIFESGGTWMKKIEELIARYDQYHLINDDFKRNFLSTGTNMGVDFMMKSVEVMTLSAFSFVIAFFISMDFDHVINGVKKYVVHYERWLNFYKTVSHVILRYIIGTTVDLLFILISVTFILFLFDFPNAIFYALLLAVLNLFPYIGAFLGVLVIAVVGFFSFPDFPWLCIVLVWVFQQIEANLIQPLIFNKTMDVHPLYLFSAMFIGEAIFGIMGLILSPVIAAIFQIALRSYFHTLNHNTIGGWEDIFW